MARKATGARPASPKVAKSQLGWNEPETFGLNSRFLGLPVTMLVYLKRIKIYKIVNFGRRDPRLSVYFHLEDIQNILSTIVLLLKHVKTIQIFRMVKFGWSLRPKLIVLKKLTRINAFDGKKVINFF